jgi:broad specificity phosphatase PhoE
MTPTTPTDSGTALPLIDDKATAFSHIPEAGFSLFLAKRTKTIHFIRHAEGLHNQANQQAGDDSPVTHSTPGSWRYLDAKLTPHGIQQCVDVRTKLLDGVEPEIIVVSPFTRTLQTAHIMFGGSGVPFVVHDGCRERSGKFTCDKRRPKHEVVQEFQPIYDYTMDTIDFDSYGYPQEDDVYWTQDREEDDAVTKRAIHFVQWLASRPENELAVVTHSSWLKHLFGAFGDQTHKSDRAHLHRLAGNAEVRSVCLALHKGFYPEGHWEGKEFVPKDHHFRRGRWAPTHERIAKMHNTLLSGDPEQGNPVEIFGLTGTMDDP